jgi:hypothetical protein
LHGRNHRGRFRRGPHDECDERRLRVRQRLVRILRARHEDLRDRIDARAAVPHVANDTDDGQPALPILVVVQPHAFADGLAVRPESSRHRLVDDGNGGSSGSVLCVEIAPARDWHAHGSEKIAAHDVEPGDVTAIRTRVRDIFHGERFLRATSQERWIGVHGRVQNTRQGCDGIQQLPYERFAARRIEVALRQEQVRRDSLARVHAQIDPLQPDEALDQEAGANQKHDGQRGLPDDQQVAQSLLADAG